MIRNPHLDGSPFLREAGTIGVLLVHGLTATAAEVRPLAVSLHAQGYSVAAPLLPGHYTHPDDQNRVKWQDWTRSVEHAYSELKSLCKKVVVGGESAGGLLTLYLAARNPDIVALLLYALALRLSYRPFEMIGLYCLSPFIRWVPKRNMDSNELWQGYPVNPLKGVVQLRKLQKVVLPRIKQIHQPLMIIQNELDRRVHPSVPDLIYNQISSTVKEIHWMRNSAYCVIIDHEMDKVTRLTLDFIDRAL
jgi:carboxylesterase